MSPPPKLPPHLLKHYVLLAPLATHWRPATCEEVQCDQWMNGFEIVLADSPRRAEQVAYLRADTSRAKTEWRRADGAIVFRFPPFTRTYAGSPEHEQHKIRIDRPELFGVADRTTNFTLKLHSGRDNGAVDWVDDFANHQDKLFTAQEKG